MSRRLVSPVLMWAIIVVGIAMVFRLVPPRFVFPVGLYGKILLFFAACYWVYFFFSAIRVHRQAARSANAISKIITTGVYGKVRHPIYSADIFLAWGLFFYYPDVRFLLGAHLLMFVMLFWMRLEERVLLEKFGQEYEHYLACVPKIIPGLKMRR